MDDIPGIARTGVAPAVAARRARQRNRVKRAVESSAGWPELGPQVGLAEGPLGEAQTAEREIARWTAERARRLAEFAATRPASADRAPGERGAMSPARRAARPEVLQQTSEWTAQESAIALTCSQGRADVLLEEALTATRLPGTLAAMEAGMLTTGHLARMLEHVAPIRDDQLRAEIEAELLRWVAARAAERMITTPPQLADRARRVVVRRGARDQAQKALAAMRDRGVYRQSERREGLAALGVVGTEAEIAVLVAALQAYADAVEDEPGAPVRTRAQKMLDCLTDLVLHPGGGARVPVQVVLTLVAAVNTVLGGDAPAEFDGRMVSAETARQLLRWVTGVDAGAGALAELIRVAEEGAPAGGAPDAAPVDAEPVDAEPEDAGSAAVEEWFVDEPGLQDWELPPVVRAALREWEAEWDRRLAAGEFDDPDPMPLEAALASAERRLASGEVDLEFERELAAAQERWWAEFEAGLHLDPLEDDPLEDDPPGRTATDPPLPGSRWWVDADRAVDDAGRAVHEAQQAVSRARRLVDTAERADAAQETAWRSGPGGRVDRARDTLGGLAAATAADCQALSHLLGRTAGGGLAERPRLALVDAVSGALVSLTDLPGLRRVAHCGAPACTRHPESCAHDLTDRPGLGAPPPSDGYRPGAALDRFVRSRDRRCRFPGCRRRVPKHGELDHSVPYPAGATAAENLAGYCTTDHRAKHQAAGFTQELAAHGTLTVTTPSGITVVTEPPPF